MRSPVFVNLNLSSSYRFLILLLIGVNGQHNSTLHSLALFLATLTKISPSQPGHKTRISLLWRTIIILAIPPITMFNVAVPLVFFAFVTSTQDLACIMYISQYTSVKIWN